MIGPIFSQAISQVTQFVSQELSKPHNQAHIAKAIGEVLKDIKSKK